eukprot:CAMPEP_0172553960 /NCGR_PEP_ID=MMETSP1067-20121228/52547_1 /TAXON_ID=265564 ORGANISM="Thalassiosira punctigera, Strain Tpunct2005C2" /NCGR_SAMPLE_ID=MMETSP1067 /ASSEMBLY_ACC=CAM_ASM_000444 /LENGTH=674 /DNA_ID=CAMNT_0013342243 /DNA_START=166 /DNA_END=2191 /DNA_ORIENTATION=+
MVSTKSRCGRSTVIIAGALFVSPLAIAAFRVPSSAARPRLHPSVESSNCNSRRRKYNNRPLVNAPVLSVSLDADEQQQTSLSGNINIHDAANDIISRAVEQQNSKANGVVNGQSQPQSRPQQWQKKQHRYQKQRNINNSRKNNKAMADPEFLRKRTDALLRKTEGSKADKRTFDWLIDAWSYSSEEDAADQALSLLSRMEELRDADNTSAVVAPDVKSYTKVINAVARSARADAGERAEEILERMIHFGDPELRPNTFTYTYVIDAYARSPSPKAPHAAQRLIEEMERLRAEGDPEVRPTTRAWNSVISAWAQWKGEEMAWGRIGSGAERAQACLDIMEEWADATGNEEVRPNSYNYNSVISALAHSQDEGAASRAEKILERMETLHRTTGDEKIKPRTATYNAIIDAWAKSGEVDAADRAELLLAHMMELYETGHNADAKPNVRSFNSVLNAWAKSGHPMAPERAAELLRRMEELDGSSDGKWDVSPDATSFATAINVYARSHAFGKAKIAHELFLHMKELYDASGKEDLRPNGVVYNSVLNACAFSIGDLEEQSQALDIANAMLVGLDEGPYGRPDQVTYGTYLKVINNQMPAGEAQDQVVEAVFRKCAKDGMVGEMVLRQLREMGMEEVFEKLVGKSFWGEFNLSDLPREWTCNVIEGKECDDGNSAADLN